jgi:hypothetical protein
MVNLAANAAAAAATGQAMLADYTKKATDYRGQYSNYQGQADAANKSVNEYTEYMKNEGSAGNQYNTAFDKQKTELGYDPEQMTMARANLNQATGALSAYSDFANTAASKWGMNAGGFAAANAGAMGSINNNIASNQGVVNGLHDIYKTAQTGANQFTGQVIQGQHETLGGLQQVFTNAANQRDSAASMMNFYDDLASKQGGLNAQQQQYYAQAQQAMASASQAMAQTSLLLQQVQQGKDYMGSSAYKKYLDTGSPAAQATAAPSKPVANAPAPAGPGLSNTKKGAVVGSLVPGVGTALGAGVGYAADKGWTPNRVYGNAKGLVGRIF